MVLTEEVCIPCNQGLGKVDEILARDTRESLIRAEKLSARRNKKDRFKERRILIRVPDEPKFGQYRGARMAIDWQMRTLRPLDQVIVRDEGGNIHSFTEGEIASADEKLFRNRPPGSIQVIGRPAEVKILLKLAASKGARFTEPTEIEPPPAYSDQDVLLETQGWIDDAVWRGIAKIAFNYLAKIQGAAYVLDEKFDRIREFIKGNHEGSALVQLSGRPMLVHDTPWLRTNEMHLVIFERHGLGLRGRVSLFNSFTYDVMLCPDLRLVYPIKSGHAFDPANETVHKLHRY